MIETAAASLPLPPTLPGRIPWRTLFGSDRLEFLRTVNRAAPDLGVVRFSFGPRTVILVKNAEAAGEVLITRAADFHKGPELGVYARPLIGRGLLSSEGDFHKNQRATINPVFSPRRIAGYAPAIVQAAAEMVTGWANGAPVNIERETTRLTLRIVGETLFGVRGVEEDADDLGHALTVTMRYFIGVIRSPLRPPFSAVPFWRGDVRQGLATLNRTIYRLIEERRATGAHGDDILSLLLSATDENGEPMPTEQVRDEAMTLFLAGHETTANALAWTFYLLAKHPAEYEKVASEIDAALNGRPPTHDDLPRMPYTLQAIKEAIRLYPPAFAFVRKPVRETSVAGFRFPEKATVLLSVYLMHRNPDYYPDPLRFDPTRFAPDAEKARPRFSYLPFGGGARVCIGAAFALMEAHLIVATVLQRARLSLVFPDRDQATETLITLRPKGGIPMRVERR